jgi:CRP-like cAMP-binding protein
MLEDERHIAGTRARVLFFLSIPELASVKHETLAVLAEAARARSFAKGARVRREGTAVDSVHVLLQGRLDIVRGSTILSSADAPSIVGLVPAMTGEGDGLGLTAASRATVLEIPGSAIRSLMQRDFSLVRTTLCVLSRRILERRGPLPNAEASDGVGTWREHELTTTEKLLQLRDTPWGRTTNLDAIAEMARNIKEVRFQAGDVIWAAGDPADAWYRLDYGRVRCEAPTGSIEIAPGQVLGMLSAYANMGRQYMAVAVTPVIGLQVMLADMLAVLETHELLAAQMTALLARQLA